MSSRSWKYTYIANIVLASKDQFPMFASDSSVLRASRDEVEKKHSKQRWLCYCLLSSVDCLVGSLSNFNVPLSIWIEKMNLFLINQFWNDAFMLPPLSFVWKIKFKILLKPNRLSLHWISLRTVFLFNTFPDQLYWIVISSFTIRRLNFSFIYETVVHGQSSRLCVVTMELGSLFFELEKGNLFLGRYRK